jgi:SOS-response transcriptional repressor LexA
MALAEQGHPIKGLTSNSLEDLAASGKVTKAELRKRIEVARALAQKSDMETPIDDDWARKVDSVYYKKLADENERRIASLEFRLTSIEKYLQVKDGASFISDYEPSKYAGDCVFDDNKIKVLFVNDIAAGQPIYQSDDLSNYIYVPAKCIETNPDDYYAAHIKGESMTAAGIPDDSIILIRVSKIPKENAIQVIWHDNRITLKRLKRDVNNQWRLCYEDNTGRYIEIAPNEAYHVLGDFVAVLPKENN